jgi:hypothetical protein
MPERAPFSPTWRPPAAASQRPAPDATPSLSESDAEEIEAEAEELLAQLE